MGGKTGHTRMHTHTHTGWPPPLAEPTDGRCHKSPSQTGKEEPPSCSDSIHVRSHRDTARDGLGVCGGTGVRGQDDRMLSQHILCNQPVK